MDGDLQHDETILPAMLRAVEQGADIAIGSRHVAGGAAADGFSAARGALSDAGTRLAQALLPVRVADPMSGFFLLRRELVEQAAPRLTGRGFKILLDLLLTVPKTVAVVEIPYAFRAREHGDSKLDATVLMEFGGLLLDKATGGLVPLRFVAFAAVGAIGVLVHMAALALLVSAGFAFGPAQWGATLVAMTANFVLNNRITYRDARLRGAALWRGLVLFYLVCGIGAAANVGIASVLVRDGVLAWGLAGAAGALITVVWNYAVSSTLVWRAR
jgi:dolichol-phosphate mannosyltransferase